MVKVDGLLVWELWLNSEAPTRKMILGEMYCWKHKSFMISMKRRSGKFEEADVNKNCLETPTDIDSTAQMVLCLFTKTPSYMETGWLSSHGKSTCRYKLNSQNHLLQPAYLISENSFQLKKFLSSTRSPSIQR